MKKNGVAKAFAPGFGQGGGGKPDSVVIGLNALDNGAQTDVWNFYNISLTLTEAITLLLSQSNFL